MQDVTGEPVDKHTPGPWELNGNSLTVIAPGMPKVTLGENGQYERPYIVCQPQHFVSPKWNSEEMRANAVLIASAPQQQATIDNLRAVLVGQREQIEAANADRARLVAQVEALQAELADFKQLVLSARYQIDSSEMLDEMLGDHWEEDADWGDEEAADDE